MFNQYEPNLESMQKYLTQESERSGDGPNWWSLPSGMSSVRILPPWDPSGRVALPVFMHPIEYKGEGMSYTKYNWTCVGKTFNKPCPICEGLAGLSAAGIDTSNWEANRRQFYFNAIVMHDPTFDNKGKGIAPGTHVLLKAPKTFYDWVIAQITNPMIGDITSVTNGIDVYVTKEGSGLGTTYNMTLSPNGRSAIPEEYLKKIENLYDLDAVFSAGFDQKQIDELVSHLKKSAGVMSNSIPNMQQQMAGYQQPAVPNGMPAMPTTGSIPPSMPNQFQPQGNGMPVAPPQFSQIPTAPQPGNFQQAGIPSQSPMMSSPSNSQPVPSGSAAESTLPKCFGQYDAGSVNCVVCPHELDCSKSKNG